MIRSYNYEIIDPELGVVLANGKKFCLVDQSELEGVDDSKIKQKILPREWQTRAAILMFTGTMTPYFKQHLPMGGSDTPPNGSVCDQTCRPVSDYIVVIGSRTHNTL